MSLIAAHDALAPDAIFAALEATWPPAAIHAPTGWRVGEGQGGGKRVSAARARVPDPDIAVMERAQAALGQPPLVMVRAGETGLDRALETRGYAVVDPTVALAAPLEALALDMPRLTAYEVAWPLLRTQAEIWASGGIGAARLAVMGRVSGPRATLLARADDAPVATAFLACSGDVAMVHALEVHAAYRRRGLGRTLMGAAARWAAQAGAVSLAVLVTRANSAAVALYADLGLREVTGYHYRLASAAGRPPDRQGG